MSKKWETTYKIIETAVDKGIRDINENPDRGIRNMVDLGTHFAAGRFQKDFFRLSKQILSNSDSPYYRLAKHMVQYTDPGILKRFGINLGYNSWTYGAEKIRKHEKSHGYNVPWVIVFDLYNETEEMLTDSEISMVLDSGEDMGVYCGMFFAGSDRMRLESLLAMLKAHKESSYFVLLQPELITGKIADIILKAGNIAAVLAINMPADSTACKKAADTLLKNKCLYGMYCTYDDGNVESVTGSGFLRQLEDMHCTFVFFIRQELREMHNRTLYSQFMQTAKCASEYSFFIVDFYEDLAYVD
ncbi:MAG TPA: hypothetical protein VN580_12255, partial [Clostridia bacterium]|nr:hypothetical protein [Clostridia bacterium]